MYRNVFVSVVFVATAFAQRDPSLDRERETIIREVRHELLMLPRIDVFDNITYRVDGHIAPGCIAPQAAQNGVHLDNAPMFRSHDGHLLGGQPLGLVALGSCARVRR